MAFSKDTQKLISQFRGLKTGIDERAPVASSKELVDQIFLELKIGEVSPLKAIHDSWNNLIPKKFAGLCEPSEMSATVLYVRTNSSVIKQELSFEEKRILAKVKRLAGCSALRKIKFQ